MRPRPHCIPKNRDTFFTWILVALFATAATVTTFSYVYASGGPSLSRWMGKWDYWQFYIPFAFFIDHSIHEGTIPLWNPLVFCGTPFAANPQSAVFYPPNLLRSLLNFSVTPCGTAYSLAALQTAHLLLAFCSVFLLARDHRLNRAASLAACVAFVFSASIVRRVVAHWDIVAAIAWTPLLLFLFRRILSSPDTRRALRYAFGAALVLGISILAGFPEIVVYTTVLLCAYWLLDHLLLPLLSHPSEAQPLRRALSDVPPLVVLFVIGGLIASITILPTIELLAHSSRGKSEGFVYSFPPNTYSPLALFKYLLLYPGPNTLPGLRGVGAGVLLLASASLFHRNRRQVFLYVALFYFLLDAAAGPPWPVASLMRFVVPWSLGSPERALLVGTLPLALLAAHGLDALFQPRRGLSRLLQTLYLSAAGVCLLGPLVLWITPHDYLPITPFLALVPLLTTIIVVSASWLKNPRFLLALIPALLFFETYLWNTHFVRHLIETAPFPHDTSFMHTKKHFPTDNRRLNPHQAQRFNLLMYELQPAMSGLDALFIRRVFNTVASPFENRAYWKALDAHEFATTNHRANLFLKRPFWLVRQYVNGPLPDKSVLFPPTTTAFIQTTDPLPIANVSPESVFPHAVSENVQSFPVTIAGDQSLHILSERSPTAESTIPLPEATSPHQRSLTLTIAANTYALMTVSFTDRTSTRYGYGMSHSLTPTVPGGRTIELPLPDFPSLTATLTFRGRPAPTVPSALLSVLVAGPSTGLMPFCLAPLFFLSPGGSPSGMVRIEPSHYSVDQADESEHISPIAMTPNSFDLTIHGLDQDRLLLCTDAYYPGWKAYIDGVETPIYLANDAFKAIVVPPGPIHHVRFVFRPWRVFVGAALSLITLVSAVAAIFLLRPRPLEHTARLR